MGLTSAHLRDLGRSGRYRARVPIPPAEPQPPAAYVVPAECPSRAAWLEALRARLPALLRTHALVESFAVQIENDASPTGYRGTLQSTASPAPGQRREVNGGSCDEVVEALSFIAALELQRTAEPAANPPLPSAQLPLEADPYPARAATSPRPWSWGAQVFTLLQGEIRPSPILDWGLGIQLTWRTPFWQPWLLLGAYWGRTEGRAPAGTSASVQLVSAHAVACPTRFPNGGALALRPCLELDLGRVSGEGQDVVGSDRRAAPWVSGGLQLRGDLTAWEHWQLGAWVGGVVPFWHARFYLVPDQVVFKPAALGLRAGAFVGLVF